EAVVPSPAPLSSARTTGLRPVQSHSAVLECCPATDIGRGPSLCPRKSLRLFCSCGEKSLLRNAGPKEGCLPGVRAMEELPREIRSGGNINQSETSVLEPSRPNPDLLLQSNARQSELFVCLPTAQSHAPAVHEEASAGARVEFPRLHPGK